MYPTFNATCKAWIQLLSYDARVVVVRNAYARSQTCRGGGKLNIRGGIRNTTQHNINKTSKERGNERE